MSWNWGRMLISKIGISMFATLIVLMLLMVGSMPAAGQACAAQNWAASTPNIWASEGSVKVMLNNSPTTNQPTIPIYADDGAYSPWGFEQHPQPLPQLNTVMSCPSGTPVLAIAGSGRETVSFQVFVSAGVGSNSALSDVTLTVSPLSGPGAAITSDNTGSSSVTRYLEGYVPYTSPGEYSPGNLQATGQMPDPLIPFYDPYDSGNPAVATPFNVQSGTTQAVWVDVTIPANQVAGTYTGTVTVAGTGVGTVNIPLTLTVWNGNLPTFDAGSVNSAYADMLRSWLPFYRGEFDNGEGMSCGGPGCTTEQALLAKYQIMGHNYDMDVQIDVDGPSSSGCYPSYGSCTSFTTDGTTSSLNWTNYDAYVGPALTPGGLFSDGTYMRVFDSPLSTAGGGAWVSGGWNWTEQNGSAPVPPAGLMSLVNNYSNQISQHFAYNHATKGWGLPELISYTFDETYNYYHSKDIGGNPLIYQIISSYNEAINSSNTSLSSTWAASTEPIHNFLTDAPHCFEDGDDPPYSDSVCADHINLSYPGGTNSTPGYTNSWVINWSSNPSVFMPGQPGPPLSYGYGTTLIAGTGYKYTQDLTEGVPALSTAPVPIERWFYQGGDPSSVGDDIGATGVGERVNYWIAYKYGLDETIPSVGDPSPAQPAPGAVWIWVGDFWGGYSGEASPSNCGGSAPSPFVSAATGGDGVLFYPGNEIGCYYSANPVGAAALTTNPAVNTSCTSNGYTVCNGISGPVASIRMEAMRRGYEDYEYMYLLGKQSGRSAPLAIVNAMGSDGMPAWGALNSDNVDASNYIWGIMPEGDAYTGNCTDPTPGAGGLPNGLPNGPTGSASSGPAFNYNPCVGLWTNDPSEYEAARVQMAQALGFAPASTLPSITGLNPSSGMNSGGTSVGISGTNFTGATEVQFGGVEATSFTVNSSTSITAISPAGNGTVDVQVFGPGGGSLPNNSDQFSYVSPVTVTGLSPNQGVEVGGNTVSITGTYFSTGATVMFGSTPATNVVVNSSTNITATAPAGSGEVNVTVTTSQGSSAYNSADLYTYEPPPTVTSVSPSSGPIAGGTSVTLGGTGFVSGMTVDFGSNLGTSVHVTSSTSLTVTSPQGSSMSGGVVNVTVNTVDGTSPIASADQFTYTSPVTVTGLSVHSGAPVGGTSVVITGTDFTGASAVKFGSNAATSFTVNSNTQITATSPAGGGTVDITVTNSPYSSAPVYADQFSYASAIKSGVFSTLPTTAVGSTSSSQNIQIILATASAISSITVPLAQNGVQEFKVGTVTGCTIGGGSNAANTVCTVPITFSPQYPGIRMGTLTVNNNGDIIGTAGLAGIGQGPEIAVTPGSLTMAIGGGAYGVTATPQSVTTAALSVSNNGSGLAMDGAGNLYIADDINCLAYKVMATTQQIVVVAGNYTYASGAVTPSTTPEPALGSNTCPQAIAVDGAGNIYIGDAHAVNSSGYPDVVEEVSQATGEIWVMAGGGSNAPGTTSQAATSVAINGINSLATDAAGNLYISDFFNNEIEKVTTTGQIVVVAGGGSTPVSTTPQSATSAQLNGPTGMVFDASGNFYLSDQNISKIEKINTSGQIYSIAGGGGTSPSNTPQPALNVALNNPAGLAVDGAGDLYIADFSNNLIEQVNVAGELVVVAGGGGAVPTSTVESSLSASLGNIEGVEVDGAGNIFIADGQNIGSGDNMVEKVSTVAAPLNFPYTDVGSKSAPQSLTLANIGNQSLTLSSVSATTDYPLQSTGTCTVTAHSGQTLTSSSNCSMAYLFDPTTGGVLDETATLTDNNLNAANSTQPLAFTGTAIGGTTVATPTFSPAAGSYGPAQTVTIGDSTSGATIYYTTNGTTPTTASTLYTSAITVSVTETVNALAAEAGYTNSAVASVAYTINGTVATPTFSPAAGSYGPAQTVTISDSTSGATIYYTTNGTIPTTASSTYSSAITVSATETLKALAAKVGYTNSAVASAAYTINGTVATPTFSPAAGTYSSAQTITISDSTSGATIYYTTNGTTPTTASSTYSSAITVSATETLEALAAKTGYTNSAVASAAYTISSGTLPSGWTDLDIGSPGIAGSATYSGTTYTVNGGGADIWGTSDQFNYAETAANGDVTITARVDSQQNTNGWAKSGVMIRDTTAADSAYVLVYVTPGEGAGLQYRASTGASALYPSGTGSLVAPYWVRLVRSGSTFIGSISPDGVTWTTYGSVTATMGTNALAGLAVTAHDNTQLNTSTFDNVSVGAVVATPTFSPAAGTYSSTQTVTISDGTSGSTIYYTTNGTTPTTASSVYSSAITVSSTETVEAIAVASGYTQSSIASAAYTINGTVATPTFSPAAGAYGPAQTVTISDSTSGATIYYTTNGTTPTTSSSVYSSAITVSATKTLEAVATKTGYTNSMVGSAAYTINGAVATPTFSPAAGAYGPAQTVTISDGTSGATIYYTTNGTTPTTSSSVYSSAITVSATKTLEAIATHSGYTNSAVGSAAYTINGAAATPVFNPSAGTYSSAQTVTISDGTSGATIYYTTNGTTPTTASSTYSSAITVLATATLKAIATHSGYTNSAVGSAAYTINLSPAITTIAGVQGGTTNPTSGMVAYGNSIGAPEGVAIAPVINGAGGDVYFDNANDYGLYVIYKGGASAAAILAVDGISSPVVGETYPINLGMDETGPWQPDGLFVDSYGNVLMADPGYNRVYMLYAGEVAGQGTNPADALITADGSTWEVGYGLHVGYLYHIADGGTVVGSAPTTIYPHDVWVDGAENVFFTDGAANGLVEAVYNTSGTSAAAILAAEGYTNLKQGSTYIIAGGQSTATYPYDNDSGSSVAYNGATSTANTAINNPWGLYGDSAGDIIFADSTSNKIKKLSGATAVLSTIGGPAAGTQTTVGHGGDGALATSAQMNDPIGVILDSSGNIYFADSGNSSVRMIGTNGYIGPVAGTSGASGAYSGEGGPATSAVMNTSSGPAVFLSIDSSSNIYISDEGNDMIHKF